jgi:PAS domain S-box-containing protein
MLNYRNTSDFLDTTQTGDLLRRLSRATVVLAGFYSLLVLFFSSNARGNAVFGIALLLIGMAVLLGTRWLHPRLVSLGLVGAVWAVLTISILTGPVRGLEDPSFTGYVVAVFLAGFLLGEYAGYGVAIISSMSGLAMLSVGVQSDMNQMTDSQAMLSWFTHTGYFAVAAVLLAFAGRIIRDARLRFYEDERTLEERNTALEREVSEREQAEHALSDKEARLRLALRVAQMTPWDWDLASGDIRYAHPQQLTWLPDLSTFDKFLNNVAPDDREAVKAATRRAVEDHAPFFVEHRLIGTDGSIHWLSQTGMVQRDANGHAISISGVTQDISERKQVEIALKHSEQRFSRAFHANPAAIVITDARDGRIVDVNASCIDLFGYAREEFVGRTGEELGLWNDATSESRAIYLRALQEAGEMREVQLRATTKSGEPIHLLAFIETFEQDGIPYYLTIYQDLRERQRLQQQTLELALQQQRAELLSEFMSKVTHDLKTPLSVIESGLYLADRIQDQNKRHDKIEQVRSQVERISQYIQDILTVLRLENVPQMHKEVLHAEALLTMSVDRMRPAAEDKHLMLSLELTPPLRPLYGDASEIERVFGNLIENAIRYTPVGGSIAVHVFEADGSSIVEVTDTGIGMNADEVEKIFNPFYRTPDAKSFWHGGTGLGLAIVQRIVQMHGGSITVKSTPGVGSTFRVSLPLYQAAV